MELDTTLTSVPVARWRTRQAVVFDWYDGPRSGACALAEPLCEFYFELLDERPTADGLDDRLFRLGALPAGATDQLIAGLCDLGGPTGPLWVPLWRFDSDAARQRADRLVDSVRADRRPTALVIATPDMLHFLGCWELARPEEPVADWFSYLGYARPVAG
jgi:hypothetical protein